MELREGYKSTEVGVIPDDWSVSTLQRLLTDGPTNGYSGRIDDDGLGTPTLRLTATTPGYLVLTESTVKRLADTISPTSSLFLRPGDVLIQRSNTPELVGTTAIFDGPPLTYVYPDLMMRLRLADPATAQWFWRYANGVTGRRYFMRSAAGSTGTMPKLSGTVIRSMPLPLPPRSEQRAIAEALSDVDALLDAQDRVIAKKRDIKQATMQQLLTGKTRLPEFVGQTLRAGVNQCDHVSASWNQERIGDVARVTTGGRNTQDAVDDGQYPFYVRSATVERINSYSFDGEAVLTAGDGVGTGKVFHYVNGKFDLHQRAYMITDFEPQLDGRFFFLYFSTYFYDRIRAMTAKSSVDSVRLDMISEMLIPLPPIKEQIAIVEVLADMGSELEAVERRREKTRALKHAMMQELLSGRTRLL